MDQSKGWSGFIVRLEHGLDLGIDTNLLTRIADQVAQHSDASSVGQLSQDDDIWPLMLERGMHRMPRPLPAIDPPASFDLLPSHIE